MKTVNSTAAAILASGQFCLADLYTFTLSDGSVYRWTSADIPLTLSGTTWTLGPNFARDTVRQVRGLEVGTLTVNVNEYGGASVGGLNFADAARLGKLDNATVLLERAILADWTQAPADKVFMFKGRVRGVAPDGFDTRLTIKSWLITLDTQQPRNLYQVQCLNQFGDSTCGVNRASYASAVTVSAVSSDGLTLTIGALSGRPDDWLTYGRATVTSTGSNQGEQRSIRSGSNSAGTLTLLRAFPEAIQVGDTLSVTPGCDRFKTSGCVRFSNTGRFRATRFVPAPDTIVGV